MQPPACAGRGRASVSKPEEEIEEESDPGVNGGQSRGGLATSGHSPPLRGPTGDDADAKPASSSILLRPSSDAVIQRLQCFVHRPVSAFTLKDHPAFIQGAHERAHLFRLANLDPTAAEQPTSDIRILICKSIGLFR